MPEKAADGSLSEQTGKLRHRIDILRDPSTANTIATNVLGEPQPSPVVVKSRWAEIESLSGREFFYANQVTSDVTHRIKFRYVQGLSEKQQIRFKIHGVTRLFEISSVLNPGELGGTTLADVLVKETTTSGV